MQTGSEEDCKSLSPLTEERISPNGTVKGHHQPGPLPNAAEPLDPEAERAVPALGRAPPRLHMLQLGLPNQGAIGKESCVRPARMRREQALHEGVIVFIRMIGPGWIGAGILQDAMDLRHVLRRECQVPASHQITLLTMGCHCRMILAG